MNKKDLRELRKNFSEASDLFTMNHVVTAFVDAEKNIRCQNSRAYHDIPEEETDCYWNTLKRVLSGTLGKGLLEYAFPNAAYEEGAPQFLLHQALNSKLEEESAVALLLDQIANQMEYVSTYAILLAHCTYTVFNKTKSDDINPYDSLDYSFLVAAVCPVELRIDGLIYNEVQNEITRKEDYDRIVAEVPSDGFIYPTFTGRGPDVNHVLCYARKPKEINVSLIEQVLGCTFTCTAQEEKEQFQAMMQEIVGEELSYETITAVNQRIQDIAEETQLDVDMPVIDDIQMRDILLDSGVSQEKAEEMQNVYREKVQNHPLSACNLAEKKTVITAPGITVQIKKDATSSVHTQNIDGHRYLMIDLDDPNIEVNGLAVQIAETNLPQTEEALLERLSEKETTEEKPVEEVILETETLASDTETIQSESETDGLPDETLPSEEDFLQAAAVTDDIPADSIPF